MNESSTKWIFGCGIGCGAIFLIAVGIFAGIYFLIKDTVEEAKMVAETSELLESRFGSLYDYIPNHEGTLDPERIGIFLDIRDSLNNISSELKNEIENMSEKVSDMENKNEDDNSFWGVLDIIKGGFGVIPQIIKYQSDRNMILFENGMGIGEYYYLYTISYYSYLKKFPGDGPDFQIMEGSGEIKINSDEKEVTDPKETKLRRNDKIRRFVNKMARRMYANTLKELNINDFWRTAFETEITELENDLIKLPWENGLPEEMLKALRIHEQRLNESYNELINSVELIDIQGEFEKK